MIRGTDICLNDGVYEVYVNAASKGETLVSALLQFFWRHRPVTLHFQVVGTHTITKGMLMRVLGGSNGQTVYWLYEGRLTSLTDATAHYPER